MPICSSIQWLWICLGLQVAWPGHLVPVSRKEALPLLALLVVFVVLLAVIVVLLAVIVVLLLLSVVAAWHVMNWLV